MVRHVAMAAGRMKSIGEGQCNGVRLIGLRPSLRRIASFDSNTMRPVLSWRLVKHVRSAWSVSLSGSLSPSSDCSASSRRHVGFGKNDELAMNRARIVSVKSRPEA